MSHTSSSPSTSKKQKASPKRFVNHPYVKHKQQQQNPSIQLAKERKLQNIAELRKKPEIEQVTTLSLRQAHFCFPYTTVRTNSEVRITFDFYSRKYTLSCTGIPHYTLVKRLFNLVHCKDESPLRSGYRPRGEGNRPRARQTKRSASTSPKLLHKGRKTRSQSTKSSPSQQVSA